jgi:hypothetical protein
MKRLPPLLLVVALLGCDSQATPDTNDTAGKSTDGIDTTDEIGRAHV